ncbi:M42 family metallopeptidase [Acidaminobacter sp.]|uniref:M42 family metallopeptidase n=1 Tax=Acidaminobacter sp. TaxID=1872102 RepID=UPI0013821DAE|nr:M20/M25/M40 family metallo-hydrolase [Acidaminobacter sp.]MDK9712421.1 M20/M25/M40 family metallo-hydrolase [Acidaminobacter sp.]MZQ97504.1 M20/M25/M40 family metallo-hydrolase [Acidaminobacter sp.]
MKEQLRKRLKELTSIIGLSGYEWDVAKYIKNELKDHVDSVEMMNCGILVARKKGTKPGPRVLVSAHMDEVGYAVTTITPNGFLYFGKVGLASEACMPGRRVWVKGDQGAVPGVIGTRSAHMLTPEEMAKPQSIKQSYVDICVRSREDAEALGIRTGSQIVPESPCQEMADTDYLCGRALDDRIGCAILIEAMIELKTEDIQGEIFAVFGILEETTVSAVSAAVNYLKPDYGLFIDTVPAGDVPDCDSVKELPIALNKGPVIILSQAYLNALSYATSHPKLVEAVRASAVTTNSKFQEFAFIGAAYLTDGAKCLYAGNGMAIVSLAIPRRYSHSPVEICHLEDVVSALKITEDFLKKHIDLTMI